MEERSTTVTRRPSPDHVWVPWLVGFVGAVLVLGPALGPGSILHLDFVLLPDLHVPRGVWGLGPELPRRVPLMLPFAWLAPLIGGSAGIKVLLLVSITTAFAGATRLAEPVALPWRLGAGVIYALSPFTLTRIGVGHIFIVAAMAILPWALPTLLTPTHSIRRTLLWSAALGFCGVYGGVVAGLCVIAGLGAALAGKSAPRPSARRAGTAFLALVIGQLPWLVPGLIVASQGRGFAGAAPFDTDVSGIDGPLRVLAGHGFWQATYQVGSGDGPWVGAMGLLLVGLALYGWRQLPSTWRGPATVLAFATLALAIVSGLGLTRDPVASILDAVAPPLRESQRLLALYLVWLAPAAVLGAQRLSARLDARAETSPAAGAGAGLALALPLVAGLVLASPGAWGIGGQLDPVDLPAEWAGVRMAIDAEPGTTLSLPWAQYLDLTVSGGDRVLNPLPLYLPGDVLATSNLRVGSGGRERNDPREAIAEALAVDLLRGEDIAPDLADLGVRWVVLMHETDREWELYQVAVQDDTSLEPVFVGQTISLYGVPGWRGPVVTATGQELALDPVVTPFQRLPASGAATWARPAASGWLRGFEDAGQTEQGLVALPAGSGPVWYWPTVLCLLADAATIGAVLWCLRRERRGRALTP